MTKKWDIEHRDFLNEYYRNYRKNHPEYVAKEKIRMKKLNDFKKEWKRFLSISIDLEN
jgi:hypothetical protein